MKNKALIIGVCGLLAGGLLSCSSIRYFDIETCKPAEVTFPESVGTVLVVGNAAEQSADVGVKVTEYGKKIDTCKFETDSLVYIAENALAYAINGTKYFNKVLYYTQGVRTDKAFYQDVKLTPEEVDSICRITLSDGIISIDRLLLKTEQTSVKLGYDDFIRTLDVEVSAVLRAYLPGRENPLATVLIKDTVPYVTRNSDPEFFIYYMPPKEKVLPISAAAIMDKASHYFVPYWEPQQRWFYKGISSRWKEATAYAAKEKWDDALGYWTYLFDKSAKGAANAKLASNIGLCYEMKGDFNEALKWVNRASELLKEAQRDPESEEVKNAARYIESLMERIQAENKLKIQFGEE